MVGEDGVAGALPEGLQLSLTLGGNPPNLTLGHDGNQVEYTWFRPLRQGDDGHLIPWSDPCDEEAALVPRHSDRPTSLSTVF